MQTKGGHPYHVVLPEAEARFDVNAFDHRIRAHGIRLRHYRAMRSPGGMTDLHDIRIPDGDLLGSSNGFLYTYAGKITALFTGNSMQSNPQDVGILDGATVRVTTPRYYDKEEETDSDVRFYTLPFDRFYLDDPKVVVPNWQLVEAHATGVDRLQYPAVVVQDLVDSSGVRYSEGVDFRLHDGQVAWKPGHGPGDQIDVARGVIYAIRYLYRPYWYCKALGHEIRVVAKITPAISGDSHEMEVMPQMFTLQREYIFEDSQNHPDIDLPDNPRQQRAPEEGSFGPR